MTAIYRKTLTTLFSALLFSFSALLHAGSPVWTLTPLTATSLSVPGNSTATVQYKVTNQSAKLHSLTMMPITGITQTTTGAGICSNPFTLATRGSSCTLSLQVNSSQLTHSITDGPIICEQGSVLQCYKPSSSNVLNINVGTNEYMIGGTVSSLTFSSVVLQNNFTDNETVSSDGPFTPSSTPSATAYDTNPTPITLSISGTNTNTLTPTINVLTYGSVYQGGFVYAINDTTPNTGSISGKVASLVDQADPYTNAGPQTTSIIWSSNGVGSAQADVSYDIIPLIAEIASSNDSYNTAQSTFNSSYSNTSTYPFPLSTAFSPCPGATDGYCNTANISTLYNTYMTNYGVGSSPYVLSNGPTTLSYYAAGLCTATINGNSDWYLPAICEMDAVNTNLTCPEGTQSMLGSLPDLIGDPSSPTPRNSCTHPAGTDCLARLYWSSTAYSGFPKVNAWFEYFASGNSFQNSIDKRNTLGVRCSRVLTP